MENEKEFLATLLNPKTQNEAYKKLLTMYKKQLYFHIRSIVLDHDDADDVLQNVFIKVFQSLKNFKAESKISTWMYRIATNESITFKNNKIKRNGYTSEEFQTNQLNKLESDTYFDGDEIQLKLQKAIAKLPEKQQLIFKMKYYQELKYEEISDILGTTVGGLKASYFHAVKKIEEEMKKDI